MERDYWVVTCEIGMGALSFFFRNAAELGSNPGGVGGSVLEPILFSLFGTALEKVGAVVQSPKGASLSAIQDELKQKHDQLGFACMGPRKVSACVARHQAHCEKWGARLLGTILPEK